MGGTNKVTVYSLLDHTVAQPVTLIFDSPHRAIKVITLSQRAAVEFGSVGKIFDS